MATQTWQLHEETHLSLCLSFNFSFLRPPSLLKTKQSSALISLQFCNNTTMSTMRLKQLSSIANDVVQKCALKLDTPVDKLVEEFETTWKTDETAPVGAATISSNNNNNSNSYGRKFVEFCSAKVMQNCDMCKTIEEKIANGSFSRFTFDMMLGWEMPTSADEESFTECVAKEKEEKKLPQKCLSEQDDISLFYSDLLPLLVDNEKNVGEDAFVWMGSQVPLVTDVVNGRFTFETLTAPTGNRLHFPSYDKYLKEIDRCIKYLAKHAKPKGVELADDEFILHVEGTASTQRVVRHIGGTSWPGRLTLTNYALYFEASGVLTYEDALKIDLSKDMEQTVKPASTGPWGAPLFDKAIIYDSPELSEEIVLEFPEVTSSTRRDLWLALSKEIMLMHRFLAKYKISCPIQAWEMHSRTILAITRLHAAREMLRISPPPPTRFLIFSLFDEIPKGDYVLEELAESLKKSNSGHPCSASSILRSMNLSESMIISGLDQEMKVGSSENATPTPSGQVENSSLLETAINQARVEEKDIAIAKATTKERKEEGISESATIFLELLRPLRNSVPWFEEVLMWERLSTTLTVVAATLIVTYQEWVGVALAALFIWLVAKMVRARLQRLDIKCNEIVVCTASDQSTIESIVSAQRGMQTVHEMMQIANVSILKLWSIYISKARKHANVAMVLLSATAIFFTVVPVKFVIMAAIVCCFSSTLASRLGMGKGENQNSRRLREWWDSIPVIPVRVVETQQSKAD
ncbi:hypothetical protein D8674_009211 [Pyrus ussuriensis x Pyrus communis]|uniref:Uncharacterized protein n=1 Tax=Pyrus ussuriensis x Pyrus communis TaxID=2448454 RepID=A0A5N5HZY5_9ROSA|nr:hypothetical protein D8674_009211 [Pyrus ussuriensis x Pyrus communis]